MKTNKNLFIKDVLYSIKNFDFYKEIVKNPISKAFKYWAYLMIVYAIIMTVSVVYEIRSTMNTARDFIDTQINYINYADGNLDINHDEKITYFNEDITIDTSAIDIEQYDSMIVFGKNRCKIAIEGREFYLDYQNIIKQNIDKQGLLDILDFKNYMLLAIIISSIVSYVTISIATLLDILIIAVIGLIISTILGNNKLKFKNNFIIAVHAITLSVVLAMIYIMINRFTGFEIKYFSTMYTSLAMIYQITAIILINTEDSKKVQ